MKEKYIVTLYQTKAMKRITILCIVPNLRKNAKKYFTTLVN